MQTPALPVVIPLLVAAILAAAGSLLPRRMLDSVAILTSAAVCAICVVLVKLSAAGPIVYWFGNWKPDPHGHFPVGVCLMIDPLGAGMAALVALLVLAALIFSWSYFESIKSLYHSLMLVFLAAMCGVCLTGDLFNLFVWFELMTATAVGLSGYKSDERAPLLGALNFAISNTVGAFLSLTAVALLYAFTGSLNMSEVGRSLVAHDPGPAFVSVAFLLLISGFLVKAAAFPFHFWLADAHAVAPTPVCILFSGVMVELGVYAIARLYWVIFAPLLGADSHAVQVVLLTMGCCGALVGGVF
ncbi:MAG TPA: proton-conducting transporter membrane subunit, partial [Tepidisphaeraceae bacterium]|nr:proton-conducting transporter membrane subunit [Tepidisphaeraceae bacterium]